MAQQVITTLIDDMDGTTEADQTVAFALDGTQYEIDLTDENAKAMREALDKFVTAGRKVAGRPAGRKSSGSGGSGSAAPVNSDNAKVREWATANGYEIGERGRIPAEIREAYYAAQ